MGIIKQILDWPVLVQGMLGSFLFWIFFTAGQKLFFLTSNKIKKEKDLGALFGKTARDLFYQNNFPGSNYAFFICIYGALHYFIKFAIAAFIGFVVDEYIPVFGFIGYILAIYFAFRALTYVTHFKNFERQDKKKKESNESVNSDE